MGSPSEYIFCSDCMEDIEQIRERIGKLADKVYNLIGKVDDREISKIMHEIIDLNEFEMILTDRKRSACK